MNELLKKCGFQKYGIVYVFLLGALAYSFTVLHFAAVYWDAPPKEWHVTSLSELEDFSMEGGAVSYTHLTLPTKA